MGTYDGLASRAEEIRIVAAAIAKNKKDAKKPLPSVAKVVGAMTANLLLIWVWSMAYRGILPKWVPIAYMSLAGAYLIFNTFVLFCVCVAKRLGAS